MEKNETTTSKAIGLGFFEALTIAFIVLKLCGVITWSWLWVLSPLWIGTAIVVIIAVIIIIVNR